MVHAHSSARIFDGGEMLVQHLMKKNSLDANAWHHGLIEAWMNDDGFVVWMIGAEADGSLSDLRPTFAPMKRCGNASIKEAFVQINEHGCKIKIKACGGFGRIHFFTVICK